MEGMEDYMECPCRNCITLVICRNLDKKTTIRRRCPILFSYLYKTDGSDGEFPELYENNTLRCMTVHRILKHEFWKLERKQILKYFKKEKGKRNGAHL